jgi:predicted site-specific integrase-resolvase
MSSFQSLCIYNHRRRLHKFGLESKKKRNKATHVRAVHILSEENGKQRLCTEDIFEKILL